jgi:hypothetical protein
MSYVWPWIVYLLEFLEADIVTGETAGRGPKLIDQMDHESMLFQHFSHILST